jgi:hypothetical protein
VKTRKALSTTKLLKLGLENAFQGEILVTKLLERQQSKQSKEVRVLGWKVILILFDSLWSTRAR